MPGPLAFDEMTNADGSVREPYLILDQWLKQQPAEAMGFMAADGPGTFLMLRWEDGTPADEEVLMLDTRITVTEP